METTAGHSAVTDVITSDDGTLLPQNLFSVYGGWVHPWSPETHSAVQHSLIGSMPTVDTDEQIKAPRPLEELIAATQDKNFHITPRFAPTFPTPFPGPAQAPYTPPYTPPHATLRGSEGSETGSTPSMLSKDQDSTYIGLTNGNTTPSWNQDGTSMDISSDEGFQYPNLDLTANVSVPSTLASISPTPPVSHYEERESSRDVNQKVQETGKGPAAASSRSSRRLAGTHATAKRRQHPCHICGKTYSQLQGVRRHQRETHKASLCKFCHSFEWGRPYRLRDHIKKWHPEVVDIDTAVDEATEMRRKVTTDSRYLSQRRVGVSAPTSQDDRQICAAVTASQPDHPLTPTSLAGSPPAVGKVPSVNVPFDVLLPEAEYLNGTDIKAEGIRPLRKKMRPAPESSCRTQPVAATGA